jgi:hypothetical protein
VFTKLIFAPVAVAGVGCFALMSRRFVEARAVALAASMSAVLVVGALVVRGEFLPFTETIKLNIAYSQGGLISTKGLASLAEHINPIGVYRLLAEVVPILLGIALVFVGLSGRHEPRSAQVAIAGACVSTLASSLAVLSITGLWDHHLQILYIPAIMTVLALSSFLDMAVKRARLMTLGLISLLGYLMAGTSALRGYIKSVQSFRETYAALGELSPEARRLLEIGSSGTYARFGLNDDLGHAIGLRHWTLACPRFHQYPFEPAALLNEVFECASMAPTLIISARFKPEPDWRSWNEFVARVERLIESYSCDASSGLRVCRRPPGNGP